MINSQIFNKRVLLSVLLAIWFSANRADWKLYSSFDDNPLKIIDTPDNTYFLVHQQYFSRNYRGWEFPSLALFEYSKGRPDEGIAPLISKGVMSGADVRLADYSPAGKYLLVAYESGMIDLISPDDEVTAIDALKRSALPGESIINSVTFSPMSGDAWIATDGGYLHIESLTKDVTRGRLDKPLSWITQAGESLIAVADGKLYESKSLDSLSFSEFTPITGEHHVVALMPLSDTEFACLTANNEEPASVISYKKEDNKWKGTVLASDYFHAVDENKMVAHRYEPNIMPNRDGYLLYSASKVWQLKRGEGDSRAVMYSIDGGDMTFPIGSWDMTDFWYYRDRGKFQCRRAEYESLEPYTHVAWTDKGEALRPKAPASFISAYMNYSPEYGQLVINHGYTYDLCNERNTTPMLLCGKKGDSWSIYSQVYETPRSVEEDPSLQSRYSRYKDIFPLADPNGLAVDPLFPNWVSCGSLFGGLVFMDISDPKREIIHFGAPNDKFESFPGFITTTPLQNWETLSLFANPEFDSSGTMWVFNGNPFEVNGNQAKSNVKYMKPEERKAFYEAKPEDYKSLKSWTTIVLPVDISPSWDCVLLCGKHPKNKNRVFAFHGRASNTLVILDHHGQPEDKDNIDYKIITHLKNNNGWKSDISRISSVAEDPLTGEIIIAALYGIYVFDPDSEVKDGVVKGDRIYLNGGSPGDIVPTEGHYYKVLFDDEGRLWIGTRNMGIVGVNPERTEVIARYNTENSPIPSDWVVGLGWNPQSSSLMVSTDRGLAEVFPDMPAINPLAGSPSVCPDAVSPGFNGAVEIRNLGAYQNIVINDLKGNEIRRIENGLSTISEWDLKDKDGVPVPSGTYMITVGQYEPIEISVLR